MYDKSCVFVIYLFIYLLIVFQNPHTRIRPMDIGTVKEYIIMKVKIKVK